MGGLRRLVAATLLAGALAPGAARGDFHLRYAPEWSTTDTRSTDTVGAVSRREETVLTQRFLADLNRRIFPLLLFNATGLYEWSTSTSETNGVPGEADARRWSVSGILKGGDRVLNGGLLYLRSEQSADTLTGALASTSPTRVSETYGLFGLWAPPALPRVDLRVSRTNLFDTTRRLHDLTTDSASVNVIYGVPRLEGAYRFRWSNPVDNISGTESTSYTHIAFAAYNQRFLEERLMTALSYQFQAQTTDTKTTKPGATVDIQVIPIQGLSAVERAPAVPARITLDANPGLVDGETSAGVGINIGYGPSLAGDVDYRDIGARFQDAATPVDWVYVHVDREIPAALVTAWTWEAYRSEDNLDWTPVAITGPAVFGAFQNRFQIPIARTQARYLKVVVRPLAGNLTTDTRWREVLVTEIQFVETVPAASLLGERTTYSGTANGSLRLQLLRSPSLYYELSGFLTHNSVRDQVAWHVTNGLALDHRLTRTVTMSARTDRTDSESGLGAGHEATMRYGASITAQPIPAAMGSIAYAGQRRDGPAGTATNNTFLAHGRADPYRGVSLGTNLGYGFGTLESGRDVRTETAQASASVVPNQVLSLTGAYTYARSSESGAGQGESSSTSQRIEGTAILTPFPALQGSVTEAHVYSKGRWYDLLRFGGSVSLLRGGELVLGFMYNENIDTAADSRLRTWAANLRWTLRAGAYVDLSYSQMDSSDPAVVTRTRGVFARLFVPLI